MVTSLLPTLYSLLDMISSNYLHLLLILYLFDVKLDEQLAGIFQQLFGQ